MCNNKCSYPHCDEKCCKRYLSDGKPHEGKCKCYDWENNPYCHPCGKDCSLKAQSNGCNKTCKLEYGHDVNKKCLCYKENEDNPHTCQKNCFFYNKCHSQCIHVCNHEKDNLQCRKCKRICKWSRTQTHLCGEQHECQDGKGFKFYCEKGGYCQIEPTVVVDDIYNSQDNKIIKYNKATIKAYKKKCDIKIPSDELKHSGVHDCLQENHLCGFQCIQCEHYCRKNYGHSDPHSFQHGNIIKSKFSITDASKFAMIKRNNEYYKFFDEESAQIFTCEGYCENQGQGHTHLVPESMINDVLNKINNNHEKEMIKMNSIRKYENNYYECKCSFFWKYILKIDFPDGEKFDYCDCICPCGVIKPDKKPNYCQYKLWHEKNIPNNKQWKSPEGHIFECDHPSGVYTIFLIDTSGSMSDDSKKPTREEIIKKHNNMLGASIEALLNYCKKRFSINRREKCALIKYNENATLIFKDIYVSEEDKSIKD